MPGDLPRIQRIQFQVTVQVVDHDSEDQIDRHTTAAVVCFCSGTPAESDSKNQGALEWSPPPFLAYVWKLDTLRHGEEKGDTKSSVQTKKIKNETVKLASASVLRRRAASITVPIRF